MNVGDPALIALIGAGSALLGAVVGQLGPFVQHWLAARQARRAVLRAKYEQLAALASELAVHLSLRLEAKAHSVDPQASRSILLAANQMDALALMYFPELIPVMQAYREAALAVDNAITRGSRDQVKAAAENFAQGRANAMDRLREFASRYA